MNATLRPAVSADAAAIAQILIDVRSAFMPYAPLVHSMEEVHSWVAGVLVPSGGTVIAESSSKLVGVLATARAPSCSWINQMAVHPGHVGCGIGSVLLDNAFRFLPLPIRLYTFQANTGARRFYERHGFRAIQLTDGHANEECCADVLYEFRGGVATKLQATGVGDVSRRRSA
jgi:GNAT superfamily N-acetyltransferase